MKKRSFLALVGVLVLAIAAIIWVSSHPKKTVGVQTPVVSVNSTPSPMASAAPGQAINPSTGNANAATPAPSVATRPASSSLAAPTGNLYSDAKPSMGGNTLEESVCQTAIGATCSIYLVSPGGRLISFAAPSINDQGGHLIDWHTKDYINSTGNWKIYAQSSLNGETSTSPSYVIEVQP